MTMRCALILAVAVAAAALPAAAGDAPATPPAPAAPSAPDSLGVGAAPAALAPLDQEVATIREAFRTRLAEASSRYAAAADQEAAAGIQREIVALKHRLEADLLAIQLRLAHERDDAEAVAELDQALAVVRERLASDTGTDAPAPPAGDAR